MKEGARFFAGFVQRLLRSPKFPVYILVLKELFSFFFSYLDMYSLDRYLVCIYKAAGRASVG